FNWKQQEDAHEFLQCFLNQLESCCNNLETKDNIVKETFGGRLLRCCNCGHLSVTRKPLIDQSLEIEYVDSVPTVLESFTKIEKIESFCERCKTQGPFEKQLLVNRSPSRFKNSGLVVQKVDKHVSFLLELDMLLYTNEINNEEMKYDLYATIVHSEYLISSRHYYSFIRCAPNKWYRFDDEKYIQIHRPFVNLIIPTTSDVGESNDVADETSLKPKLNKNEDNDSPDEEFMDALHDDSHGSSVNEKKTKLED
ncbi:hypothetical protein H5410_056279, partial [Solanum commersonii]